MEFKKILLKVLENNKAIIVIFFVLNFVFIHFHASRETIMTGILCELALLIGYLYGYEAGYEDGEDSSKN